MSNPRQHEPPFIIPRSAGHPAGPPDSQLHGLPANRLAAGRSTGQPAGQPTSPTNQLTSPTNHPTNWLYCMSLGTRATCIIIIMYWSITLSCHPANRLAAGRWTGQPAGRPAMPSCLWLSDRCHPCNPRYPRPENTTNICFCVWTQGSQRYNDENDHDDDDDEDDKTHDDDDDDDDDDDGDDYDGDRFCGIPGPPDARAIIPIIDVASRQADQTFYERVEATRKRVRLNGKQTTDPYR